MHMTASDNNKMKNIERVLLFGSCSVEVDLIRILQVLMANITSSNGNDITQAASAKLFARIHHEGLLHVIGSHHES